jgi:outer membrane protein assembly factor BamB
VFDNRGYVATENDVVYALSAETGAIVWSARLGIPVPAGTRLLCSPSSSAPASRRPA